MSHVYHFLTGNTHATDVNRTDYIHMVKAQITHGGSTDYTWW